jgi:hypothetical protein
VAVWPSFIFFYLFFLANAYSKEVKIEWNPIDGAIQYEIRVLNENGLQSQKKVTDPIWKGDLNEGIYSYQIRTIDEIKRPGIWSSPRPLVIMPSPPKPVYPLDGATVPMYSQDASTRFKWDETSGIKKYSIEIKKDGKAIFRTIVDKNHFSMKKLESGKYSWKVNPVVESDGRSPASMSGKQWESQAADTQEFEVVHKKLEAPHLKYPVGGAYVPSDDQKMKFKWKPVEGAEGYDVKVLKTKKKATDPTLLQDFKRTRSFIAQENNINIRIPSEGSYVWKVHALAHFDDKNIPEAVGPDSIAQFDLDRNAVFKDDLSYFEFSAMYAPFSYQIVSPINSLQGRTQSDALVFRLRGEYLLSPHWAIDAGADYAIFQLANQTFGRNEFELLGKYRVKIGQSQNGWYLFPKLGVDLRDYGQLIPAEQIFISNRLQITQIDTLGARVGLDLTKQWSEDFSIGMRINYFFPVFFLSGVPSGSSVSADASYRNISFGIQGIYWFNRNWGLGLGGFFENRSISYTTPNYSSQSEQIYMDASYIFGSIIYRLWR